MQLQITCAMTGFVGWFYSISILFWNLFLYEHKRFFSGHLHYILLSRIEITYLVVLYVNEAKQIELY